MLTGMSTGSGYGYKEAWLPAWQPAWLIYAQLAVNTGAASAIYISGQVSIGEPHSCQPKIYDEGAMAETVYHQSVEQ